MNETSAYTLFRFHWTRITKKRGLQKASKKKLKKKNKNTRSSVTIYINLPISIHIYIYRSIYIHPFTWIGEKTQPRHENKSWTVSMEASYRWRNQSNECNRTISLSFSFSLALFLFLALPRCFSFKKKRTGTSLFVSRWLIEGSTARFSDEVVETRRHVAR